MGCMSVVTLKVLDISRFSTGLGLIFGITGLFTTVTGPVYGKTIMLTHCILSNFNAFLLSADLFFQNYFFLNIFFRNTIGMSKSLDPAQARWFVGIDLGLYCLPSLSADDTGRQRVKSNASY